MDACLWNGWVLSIHVVEVVFLEDCDCCSQVVLSGVAVPIFNSILDATDRSWDNSFTDSVCSVFFRDAFVSARSCTSGQLVEFKKKSHTGEK